jgi:hypothetical protein
MEHLKIELLTPERVTDLWFVLEPLFTKACEANEVAVDISADDIYKLSQEDRLVIFACFDLGRLYTVCAIQFHTTNGRKGADVVAMAGKNLMTFKAAFWQAILEWLKANGVQFLDAYTQPRLAKIFQTKFGFTKSCTFVRMTL